MIRYVEDRCQTVEGETILRADVNKSATHAMSMSSNRDATGSARQVHGPDSGVTTSCCVFGSQIQRRRTAHCRCLASTVPMSPDNLRPPCHTSSPALRSFQSVSRFHSEVGCILKESSSRTSVLPSATKFCHRADGGSAPSSAGGAACNNSASCGATASKSATPKSHGWEATAIARMMWACESAGVDDTDGSAKPSQTALRRLPVRSDTALCSQGLLQSAVLPRPSISHKEGEPSR